MNLFGLFGGKASADPVNRARARSERLAQYARYLRSYQGYSVRGVLNTNVVRDWHRVKFNFVQPVVNLAAGWFAAKGLDWDVDGDPAATKECYAIWQRSGGDGALLENAILCGIYGDLAGVATQDDDGRACMEFIDPSICTPVFDGADYSRLRALEIAYETRDARGEPVFTREVWDARGMERFDGDAVTERRSYDTLPAVWIRNSSIKGLPFGLSDVEPLVELVEEYDHLAGKQTRIVDYYSAPSIVFSGIQKGSTQLEKSVGTVFYLPVDGKASFLEWSGSGPDISKQLERIRAAIAEVSQVPAVAFGTVDGVVNNISGVAIKILYGPLLSKTHRKQACWRPALERLMWLCLRAAGHDVALESVNVRFADTTPVDGQAAIAESSGKIASRLASRRTEMNNQGIEDPDAELLRIIIEEKMLQLAVGGVDLATDTNRAAALGARGRFVMEEPAEIAGGGGQAQGASPTLGDAVGASDDDITELKARFAALVAVERDSKGEK